MRTPPQIVWQEHGSPRVEACVDGSGRCYLCCGEVARGQHVEKWMGGNFTDQPRAKCPPAEFICEACCYITSRTSPVMGRPAKDGNKFGANFRNVSHLWEDGIGYSNASKGEKPAIRAFIEREHAGIWWLSCADSGQKHVLPFAALNGPGRSGIVLLDDATIVVPRDVSLIESMARLLTAGATKEAIGNGSYGEGAWRRCEEEIRAFEREYSRERGSGWFTLALWLAQRDEESVQARLEVERAEAERKHGSTGRKGSARGNGQRARGPQRSVHDDGGAPPAEALAEIRATTAPEPERCIVDGPVAREDAGGARHHEHEQLTLFGAGVAGPMPRRAQR